MHNLYNGIKICPRPKNKKKYTIGAEHSKVTFQEKKKKERKTSSLAEICLLLTGHWYII